MKSWGLLVALVCVAACQLRGDQPARPDQVGRYEPQQLSDGGPIDAGSIPCTRAEIADDDAGVNEPGTLHIEFTSTPPYPGVVTKYNQPPNGDVNGGVIWIEDQNGALVKTLDYWGGPTCLQALLAYIMKNLGGCKIDTVARATVNAYEHNTYDWNSKSLHGSIVPDGNYTLLIDVQIDGEHPLPIGSVPFTESRMPFTISVPSMPPQTGLTLTYMPN
jgi:hypothetical protein